MTNVTILSIFRTHAQMEYRNLLEMKGTYTFWKPTKELI